MSGDTRKTPPATELIRGARKEFEEITGLEIDSVSAFTKTDHGWEMHVEVVELARIPDTTSVLATYAVHLEPDGEFAGYERLRRYGRGQLDR